MSDLPSADEIREIEQFLYEEAFLLDERRFPEWLGLFTDDARYWMPTRNTLAKSQPNAHTSVDDELTTEGELAWFDDSKLTLVARVARLQGGIAWAEDPPSRTRRLLSNIHVASGEAEGEFRVRSYFLLHRTRHQIEREVFVGCRHDVLRRTSDGLRIARRKIVLDDAVLASPNLSVFF